MRGKHHRGTGTKRVDVSTYTSKKGREGVQLNFARELALEIAVDRYGTATELLLDTLCELIEREEAGVDAL